ncbi:MAG: type II secretion system protein [Verrucomicrobia bacterium]|nr:type II secretion system protein [Verrucomicrobiota bacterium]MDA1088501.1 type II secretion system protein [Verrucomicrobiota bacterium]
MHTPRITNSRRAGFTLIELLVVIGIIMILAALLFPAIASVKRKVRLNMALAEMAAIDQGWRAYMADYKGSPTNKFSAALESFEVESEVVPIKGDLAKTLMGQNLNENNPRERKYVEFKRLDENGDPVTPWWRAGADRGGLDRYAYYVKLDYNFDNYIEAGDNWRTDPPEGSVGSAVIVWSYNQDKSTTERDYLVSSW